MNNKIPTLKNKRHKSFADLLLKDPKRNKIKAYRKVFNVKTNDTAKKNASRLLTNADLLAYIEAVDRKTTEKVELSVEWVKEKLKRFSNAKITDYFTIINGSIIVKDLSILPSVIIDCIQEIQETKGGIKIKLVDKKGSVTDIGRTLGAFTDNINLNAESLEQIILDREKKRAQEKKK